MSLKVYHTRISRVINEKVIRFLSQDLSKTDEEIAGFFEVDRTAIVHMRRKYGICKGETVGEKGERMALDELRKRGFEVKDMNAHNKLSPFDLLVDHSFRVEVKTATYNPDFKRFTFAISERAETGVLESETRFKLPSGRLRKDFSKTCDVLIFVGLRENKTTYYVIPSNVFPKTVSTFSISESGKEYEEYREAWDYIKLKTRPSGRMDA